MSEALHRAVEQQAVVHAGAVAIVDRNRSITYRELNYAANAMARRLQSHGFRRGMQADVTAPAGIELAIVLLAVLKAGGAYAWHDPGPYAAASVSLSFPAGTSATESRHLHLELPALAGPVACSPNLPIVTRASDIACVMLEADGIVCVPHGTLIALRPHDILQPTPWGRDPGAFDLWIALMSGTTAIAETHAAVAA